MTIRPRDLAPGLLVAATGIGAGDLITASLAGSELGVVILWAAVAGAVLKLVLNEGLARWQLATGETLLAGWVTRLPAVVRWAFLIYLLLWSFVVGGALVNACGIAASAFLPLGDADNSRMIWGAVHSIVGLVLVRAGSFRAFESVMAVCIAAMFVCVCATAVLLSPDWSAVGMGLVNPTVPEGGLGWVLGVLGGVGGTVTLLSYGYWIREHGRHGPESLGRCRLDLAVAYGMTAFFGIAMILIGSRLQLEGRGAGVVLALADQLETVLGPAGRLVFLLGFWGAVFSSLLGVWQGVPYLFADFTRLMKHGRLSPNAKGEATDPRQTRAYRGFQIALALLPLSLLALPFRGVQLAYAVLGALFMPFLAATLLFMNNRTAWIGERLRNGLLVNMVLLMTLLFFAWQGLRRLLESSGT
jgi:Mn2+/Fe2+ NRAMP family transporter